jgi:hypothetical protein
VRRGIAMPKICGEVRVLQPPTGGGVHTNETIYRNVSTGEERTERTGYKSRMVFPLIQIGDSTLKRSLVANDDLGHEIADKIVPGQRACFFVYGHLLRRKCIIGVKTESGEWYRMPQRGFVSGLFWYAVFSPIIVGLAGGFVGALVGGLGGRQGSVFGLFVGVIYGLGISWYSGVRFYKTYQEMSAET